jgi:hypothetical protein
MLDILVLSVACSYFLLVWLNTDALFEYLDLFKLTIGKKFKEYKQLKHSGYSENYSSFLREYYSDKFIVRLVTCPVCVSFWLGLSIIGLSCTLQSVCAPALILFFYLLLNKMF